MTTRQITDNSFENDVIKSKVPVLVDFWAEWCAPCKQLAPVLEEISSAFKNKLIIGKIDIDNNPETPTKYQIRGIPTIILFINGEIVDTRVGSFSKIEMESWLNEHLE